MSYYMKESTYGHDFVDPISKSGRNPYPIIPGRIPPEAYGAQRPEQDYSPRGPPSPRISPRGQAPDPYMNRGPPPPQIDPYLSPRDRNYGNVSPGGRPMNNSYDRQARMTPRLGPGSYERPLHPSPRPDALEMQPQWQRDSRYDQYRPTQKDYGQYAEKRMQEQQIRHRPGYFIDDKYLRPEERKVSHSAGVYMMIRTQANGIDAVKMALKRYSNVLKQAQGHLKGISTPEDITLLEGEEREHWHLSHPVGKYGDAWVYNKPDSRWETTDDAIVVLWFPTYDIAKHWLEYDKEFKISGFPDPYGADIFIVPTLKNPVHDRSATTFLMTEFPGVRDFDGFRDRVEGFLEKAVCRYDAHPNVVFSRGTFHIRGSWVHPSSTLVVHRFANRSDAYRFHNDPDVQQMRDSLVQMGLTRGRPTSVLFTLKEFQRPM